MTTVVSNRKTHAKDMSKTHFDFSKELSEFFVKFMQTGAI